METLQQFSNANILLCVMVSPQGVILNANAVFGAYFTNSLGKNYRYLIAEDCQSEVEKVCLRAKTNPGKYHLLQVRARIIGHKWAWFSLEVFYKEKENVFGLIGVKAIEEASKDTLLLDRYRNRMREIAFIQSHDVRAPLARILALSDLQKSLDDIEEIKKLSALIWDSSSDLDKVVKKNIGLTYLEE
jgi:signal transduction histidine kinase